MRRTGTVGWGIALVLACAPAGCGLGATGGAGPDVPEVSPVLPPFPQMPSHAVEEAAIGRSLEALATALEAGDTAAAAALFTDEASAEARSWLDAHPDLLAEMAGQLREARTTSVSDEFGWRPNGSRRRSAEVSVEVDGVTLYVGLEKVGDDWRVGTF